MSAGPQVREALVTSALLLLPLDMPRVAKEAKVDALIASLVCVSAVCPPPAPSAPVQAQAL